MNRNSCLLQTYGGVISYGKVKRLDQGTADQEGVLRGWANTENPGDAQCPDPDPLSHGHTCTSVEKTKQVSLWQVKLA